jgi:hypothetical protein
MNRLPMLHGKAEADPVLTRTERYIRLLVLHNHVDG